MMIKINMKRKRGMRYIIHVVPLRCKRLTLTARDAIVLQMKFISVMMKNPNVPSVMRTLKFKR